MGNEIPDVLDEVVQRIVAVADPEKIILFGSAARGELGPDSDLDLLVVKSGCIGGNLPKVSMRSFWASATRWM